MAIQLTRILRHIVLPDWWVMRAFPPAARAAVEAAIVESEKQHQGELRFVIEAGLPIDSLFSNQSPHDRAVEAFSRLKVWDTEHNSGVLIYLQLTDRQVEIVADRGINARVDKNFWAQICAQMQAEFHQGRFESGAVSAIRAITNELTRHFPENGNARNELPDRVELL